MTLTAQELRAIGAAAYGYGWQSALARAIGISDRTMRRLVAGTSPITERVERDIRRVLGAEASPSPDWPRDEWILGDGLPGPDGARREYLVHTRSPRFVARVIAVDGDGAPDPSEGEADTMTGVVYASQDCVIAEIVWIDPPPAPAALTALMEAAARRIRQM